MTSARAIVLRLVADVLHQLARHAEGEHPATRPPPAAPQPAIDLDALRRDVMRELGAELERVAPWLYEPITGEHPDPCSCCGERQVRRFGVPFTPSWSGATPMQRTRCLRCGVTSTVVVLEASK